MGWGDTLLDLGSQYFTNKGDDKTGSGLTFLTNLINQNDASSKEQTAANDYATALKTNKELQAIAANLAANKASYSSALNSNLYGLSNEMITNLKTAQNNMGAMPQIDQSKINSDYSATKATMLNDFNDFITNVNSTTQAEQIDRMGGATSRAMDAYRTNTITNKYAPLLQKIDDAAYDSAVSRATSTNNLITSNRENTLKEISSVYSPTVNAQQNLLNSNSDISNLLSMYGNYTGQAKTNEADASKGVTKTGDKLATSFDELLKNYFS